MLAFRILLALHRHNFPALHHHGVEDGAEALFSIELGALPLDLLVGGEEPVEGDRALVILGEELARGGVGAGYASGSNSHRTENCIYTRKQKTLHLRGFLDGGPVPKDEGSPMSFRQKRREPPLSYMLTCIELSTMKYVNMYYILYNI